MIQRAAEELFAAQGYAITRLEDVAAAAGISKQLLHRHFASKRDLHLALLEKHRAGIVSRIAAGMGEPGTLEERIRGTADGWLAYVEDHPYAARLLFRDTTGDPAVVAFHHTMRESARAANVAVLRAEPGLRLPADEIEPLAELIRAAFAGLALWWAEHPETPRATLVDLAARTLTLGIAGGGAQSKPGSGLGWRGS